MPAHAHNYDLLLWDQRKQCASICHMAQFRARDLCQYLDTGTVWVKLPKAPSKLPFILSQGCSHLFCGRHKVYSWHAHERYQNVCNIIIRMQLWHSTRAHNGLSIGAAMWHSCMCHNYYLIDIVCYYFAESGGDVTLEWVSYWLFPNKNVIESIII